MSCSKDEDSAFTSSSVIGKWQITKIVSEGSKDGIEEIPLGECGGEVYEFTENGRVVLTEFVKNTDKQCVAAAPTEDTYRYNADTKTLRIGNGTTWKVRKLTATELIVVQHEEDTDGDGKPDPYVAVLSVMERYCC